MDRYAKMLKADPIHRIPKGAEVKVGPKEGGLYSICYKGRLGWVPISCIEAEPVKEEQIIMEGFDATFTVKKEKF